MSLQLTGNDRHGSPQLAFSGTNNTTISWSPFGGALPHSGIPGFNGERQDPMSGVTHLGNGYRAYSPTLQRFTCPDSESPFGIGGINPYVYCDNDPVNHTDPDGHGPITWLVEMIILGVRTGLKIAESEAMASALATAGKIETGLELAASAATGIASSVMEKKGRPETATKLGWAAMGLGLAGGFGIGEVAVPAVGRKLAGLSERLGRIKNIGLSGRGAVGGIRDPMALAGCNEFSGLQATGAAIEESPKGRGILKNLKQDLFNDEWKTANHALSTDNNAVSFTQVRTVEDLEVLKNRNQVHKFIYNADGELAIGSIDKNMNPKTLSHPVVANLSGEADPICAGYIYRKGNKLYIVNHSGHYHPGVNTLRPTASFIQKNFGLHTTKVTAGSLKHGMLNKGFNLIF